MQDSLLPRGKVVSRILSDCPRTFLEMILRDAKSPLRSVEISHDS